MKKRFTGKKASVSVLVALIIVSIAEVILRSVLLKEAMFSLLNAGGPFITAVLSIMLIIFAAKGKDRLFYILCGAWLSYFVLNQIFALPGMIATIATQDFTQINAAISYIIPTLTMISVIVIGGLLVKYMADGSIYNKAFNTLCIITIILLTVQFLHGLNDTFVFERTNSILVSVNALSRICMIFLFTFFAYDSAKKQLAKTQLQ